MPNSEFGKKLSRSTQRERPVEFNEADWDALSRRLDREAAPLPFPWVRALAFALLGGLLLVSVLYIVRLRQQLTEQENTVLALQDRVSNLQKTNVSNISSPIVDKHVENPVEKVVEVERIVYRDRWVERPANKFALVQSKYSLPLSLPNLPNPSPSDALTFLPLAETAKLRNPNTTPTQQLSTPTIQLKEDKIPLSYRLRPTGTSLNVGAGLGRPEVISSSETISHYALNAGARIEYGVGDQLRLLAGVDWWKISYGGLNVRYLPEFLHNELGTDLPARQSARHFLATQRMQRYGFGLKFSPSVSSRWRPYFAATANLERQKNDRLLFVVYDNLLRQNLLIEPTSNHTYGYSDLEWTSLELRPGLSYQFAERFDANAELYYALPIDAGTREARFAPRAGLRLGVGWRWSR